jgi:hypothetical protein
VSGLGAASLPPFGTVLLPGSAWFNGAGVDVRSNGVLGCYHNCGVSTPWGIAYQCVELINHFITARSWSGRIGGNAVNIYANAPGSAYDKHGAHDGYQPVPGDIIVWHGGWGGYGHVAVVIWADGAHVVFVEQNASPTGQNTLSRNGDGSLSPYGNLQLTGFLHAKANGAQSTITPPPPGGTAPVAGGVPIVVSPPPAGAQGYPHKVYGTCLAGACGLHFRSGPHLGNGVTRTLLDGTAIQVICQVMGDSVSDGHYTSAVWDRTMDGDWASDLFVDTSTIGAFSPPIPQCDGNGTPISNPPPPSSYTHHVYHTGGLGLWFHSAPTLGSGHTRIVADGAQVDLVCQTTGDSVFDGVNTSTIWDKTANGDYASDLYIDTANIGVFSPPIPQC